MSAIKTTTPATAPKTTSVPAKKVVPATATKPVSAKPMSTPVAKPVVKAAPAPVPAPVPVKEDVVAETPAAVVEGGVVADPWEDVLAKFDTYDTTITGMIETLKTLQKELRLQKRNVKTTSNKRRKRVVKPGQKPSGFQKPVEISAELKTFLGVDEMLTRNQVTNLVIKYIKDNSLNKGKDIHPDAKLRALLKPEDHNMETFSFFGMQKLLKHHYPTAK